MLVRSERWIEFLSRLDGKFVNDLCYIHRRSEVFGNCYAEVLDGMQEVLKFILVAVATGVIGYICWTLYGEGTRPASGRMSDSLQIAQRQAQGMNQALTSVSAVGNSQGASARIIQSGTVVEITDLKALQSEWIPRYRTAKLAYAKFSASIANAKSAAADYFAQQQAITVGMRDPDNRAKAQQQDDAEMLLYRQWEARADAALQTANEIGIQLDDMDANLKKMELRASFVFDTSAFLEVPEAVTELNAQLADFQTSSDNIRAVSGSPFGVE